MKTKNLHYSKALCVLCALVFTFSFSYAQINVPVKPQKPFSVHNFKTNSAKRLLKMANANSNRLTGPETTYWKSKGWGLMSKIYEDTLVLYSSTLISIVSLDTFLLDGEYMYGKESAPMPYILEDSAFIIDIGEHINFSRIDSFPNVLYSGVNMNPVINFEVFWNTYKENCPLFELTHTNWDSIYSVYSPQVTNSTSDEDLFTIFTEMQAPLKDGHTFIADNVNEWYYSPGPEPDIFWYNDWEIMLENARMRVDNQEFKITADGAVLYGKIDGSIGFIFIASMGGYDPEGILSDNEYISLVMDTLVDEFADCKSIIVDIRLNGGGNPSVSLEIASRFNNQPRVAYWYEYRDGGYNEYSIGDTLFLETNDKNFGNKPVILLASNYSMSAADIFAMVMKDIPNVTLVGDHTYGIFSTYLGVNLPNNWIMGYTMMRVYSSENINYEQVGIYPDVEISQNSTDYYNGIDNVLEKAIEMLSISDIEQITSEPVDIKIHSNPFREQAVIDIMLPEGETAELTIVDMAGRILADYRLFGSVTLEWNASGYNDGVYFCSLKSALYAKSIKIIKAE